MDITINIIELSSTLAHKRLVELVMHSTGCDEEQASQELMEENEEGILTYTDEYQDLFNEYYDEYWDIIEQSKAE
jgi:hypothetical protein